MKLKRQFYGASKGHIYPVAYNPGDEVPDELLAAAKAAGAFEEPVEVPGAVTIAPQRVFQMAPGPNPPKEEVGGRKGNSGRKGKQAAVAGADGADAGNAGDGVAQAAEDGAGDGSGGAAGTQDGVQDSAGDGGDAGDNATATDGATDAGDGTADTPPSSGEPKLGGLG